MTKAMKRKRRQAGYEEDVPRCASCTQFQTARTIERAGSRYYQPARCALHEFHIKTNGVCDSWMHKNGDTLE